MKLLVCARHFGYLRNFEAALAALAERGHTLHLAADRPEKTGGHEMVLRLADRFPGVSIGWTPPRTDLEWVAFSTRLRLGQDYLRFMEAAYDDTPKLRERARERAPEWIEWFAGRPGPGHRHRRAAVARALQVVERAIPVPRVFVDYLEGQQPDVVMLTPLIDLGSPQLDMLKAARAGGWRSALTVGSWDHLSSKALVRIRPDLVTVWNPIQLREATEMHHLPASLVEVTGAQCYDKWFDRLPSRSREVFCQEMGLPSSKPLIVYLCSSPFRNEPPEVNFVKAWLEEVRRSPDPLVSGAAVLVRPHPGRLREWSEETLEGLGPVALYGSNPIDDQARDDYFDTLYHCAAVAGLNTSAFIEAGIAARPVHAILPPQYRKSQEGTLHFHYLLKSGGGLLRTSRTFEEHLAQLSVSLRRPPDPELNRSFVEAFVRPYSIGEPATPRFVSAMERLAARPRPRPQQGGPSQHLAGSILLAWIRRRRTPWKGGTSPVQPAAPRRPAGDS